MKVVNGTAWYSDRSVDEKVGRVNICGVDIDVGSKVGSGNCEGVELKYVDKVGSGEDNSVNKVVKVVRCGVIVGLVTL